MRCLLTSLALSAGALGILAMSRGEAKAFPPMGMSGFRNMGFGRTFSFGMPTIRTQTNSSMVTRTIMSPSSVRTVFGRTGVERLFFGPGTKTVSFNSATGLFTTTSVSPSVTKILFTPYSAFRRFNTPQFGSFTPLIRTPNLGFINNFGNPSWNWTGGWHHWWWPTTNIPFLGAGAIMPFPLMNFGTFAGFSSVLAEIGENMLGSNTPAASPSNANTATADAYKDYLPPGYIK